MDSSLGDQSIQGEAPQWDYKLVDRFFKCLQREVRDKPPDKGIVVLQELLDTAHADSIEQMLEYFFDDFMRLLGTDCFLRLQEKCQDHRFLCVLIRKIQEMCQGGSGEATLAALQCSAQQWTAFAIIIADLEKQDSHLVVSTLEEQLPQLQLMSSDLGERWLSWLRTLCLRLLQEERIQVLRKALEYFLNHLSVEDLCRLGLLSEFLMATNRSQLFDPEDDNCLTEEKLELFVADGNVEVLLEALVSVAWENVPLLLWIRSFKRKQVRRVPKELFIKLCLVVRAIDNYDLRQGSQGRVFFLFEDTIDGFSLTDYMICIESLYQKWDPYRDNDRLLDKIAMCTDFEEHIDCFNRRSYDIIFYLDWNGLPFKTKFLETLLLKMESLPKHKHGFLRLVLFKPFMDFYRKFYNVDISMHQKGASLEKMQDHLLDRMKCQTDEETSFLKARCVDLFISNLESWCQLEELNLDPMELMDKGTDQTITGLTELLGEHEKRIKDEKILPALNARVRRDHDIKNVLRYAYNNLTEEEYESYITNFLLKNKCFTLAKVKLNVSVYLKLLLHGEPTGGRASIEAAFAYNLFRYLESNACFRYRAITNLYEEDSKIKYQIFKELLKINEKLSIEHPHYPENSKVHRQKMRVASVLITLRKYCDNPKSLETLLLPSDHLGINPMHEFLVGNCVENIDWVLKALPSLQPRQQESYLSIAHIFISKNLIKLYEEKKLSNMLTSLQPLTMGPCDETRTLAQLILHKIALECEVNSIHIPVAKNLMNLVETVLGKKLYELQSDPRLMLAEILIPRVRSDYTDFTRIWEISYYILYITNAPFDETRGIAKHLPKNIGNKIRNARQAFRARKLLSSAQFAPSNNLYKEIWFEKNSELFNEPELIVVASLLDKETHFGRLMLTCQMCGVDTLVLGDESYLQEYDSGNLRISEVNPTRLVECLMKKEAEGSKIYGCMGVKGFYRIIRYNYMFLRSIIVVMGHQKHGIPDNVIKLLINPMEIQ